MNAESEISRVLFSLKSRDHLSRAAVTSNLQHPTRSPDGPPDYDPIWTCSGWGLPCQVCRQPRGELLPPRFTLACAEAIGGLFSVALSVGSRRLAVSQHPCPMLSGLSSSMLNYKIRQTGDHVSDFDFYLILN